MSRPSTKTGETKENEMALSDYLTDDEWDGCFYASMGKHAAGSFGESMRKSIDALIKSGYKFHGLDEKGQKREQVPSNNPSKALIFLGNPHGIDVLQVLENGRNFWKRNLPDVVDETDEEWAKQMSDARQAQMATKEK